MIRDTTVITRFPPSPTGLFHIGSARTALFNYLFAKQNNGKFLLRFEDTDKERNKKEYEKDITDGLKWLGITYDEKILRQSERGNTYKQYLTELLEKGAAYEAEVSKKGSGKVIRFKNPNIEITFTDLVRGEVMFDTTELGNFVIARDKNTPLYHLTVVVDDIESGITHVIRGEDHISNTPRQILILESLGHKRPHYAHIPLILAPDKSKLSKRHGAVSINKYKDMGVLPEALVNYLALLGWHPHDEREILSIEKLTKEFDLSRVQKGGAVFDLEKLRSINREYVQKLSDEEFLEYTQKHLPESFLGGSEGNKRILKDLVHILRERIQIFSDIKILAEKGELDYFFQAPKYENSELVWKDSNRKNTYLHLTHIYDILSLVEEKDFTQTKIKDMLWNYATEHGKGDVLWPMRYALSGKEKSPDPFLLAEILCKEKTLIRIKNAIHLLS